MEVMPYAGKEVKSQETCLVTIVTCFGPGWTVLNAGQTMLARSKIVTNTSSASVLAREKNHGTKISCKKESCKAEPKLDAGVTNFKMEKIFSFDKLKIKLYFPNISIKDIPHFI